MSDMKNQPNGASMKPKAKNNPDTNKVLFTIQLSEKMNDAVDRVAIKMQRPRSFIVREAIAYYLATQKV
jgi:hypothetical protein